MKRLALIIVALIIGCDPSPELQVKQCVDACEKAGMYVQHFTVGSACVCLAPPVSNRQINNLERRIELLERDGGLQ